jgi:hypothetical protein
MLQEKILQLCTKLAKRTRRGTFHGVFFTFLRGGGVVFVHVVKLHVFTFLVSFGDVRYDFHVKTMSLLPYVL